MSRAHRLDAATLGGGAGDALAGDTAALAVRASGSACAEAVGVNGTDGAVPHPPSAAPIIHAANTSTRRIG